MEKIKNPFTPDFKNAKKGDKVFSIERGNDIIEKIDKDSAFSIEVNEWGYTIGGFYSLFSAHPSLFNSLEQCKNYFAWEFEQSIKEPEYELAKQINFMGEVFPIGTPVKWSSLEIAWEVSQYGTSLYISNPHTETKESAIKRLIESGIVREVVK